MRRQRINKAILTGVMLLGFTVVAFGRLQNDQIPSSYQSSGFGKTAVEYNLPAVDLSWVGAGQLTVYTTTNTGQHGLFGPPPGWQYYDGTYPSGHSWFRGYTGEFPRGTKQYYCWAAGIWIGGMADEFKKDPGMIDLNSIGHTWMVGEGHRQFEDGLISGVRVATTGYYSEMSTISELWQSNQRINGEDDGWMPQDKGNFRFGQKAKEIEGYQEPWAFFEWTGQEYWAHPVYENFEYADTVYRLEHGPINSKRRVVWEESGRALDSTLIFLDPFREDKNGNITGDIVSDEDTYTVYGDYIPEKFMSSSSSWAREGYDVAPLGVQVIQRTYSWTIDDYVYMNFKIRNMNDFDLEKMYVGYFMDNDVGWADDDQIGFDDTRNLGYTYDSDFAEPGWPTSAGYLGCVYVETPRAGYEEALTGDWFGDGIDNDNDGEIDEGCDGLDNDYDTEIDEDDEREQIGLSSFQTWVRSDLGVTEPFQGDVDDDGMDFAKYFEMAVFSSSGQDSFEVFEDPIDVRQLASSGPVLSLQAGKEMSVTIAFVAGSSLADLKANADDAIQKYYTGFIGPEAPPAPGLVARPGHKKIYLAWDDSPEDAIDPFSGDKDFEGYRVYRSSTGLEDEWDMLMYNHDGNPITPKIPAEFDVDTSQSEAAARTIQFIGSSNAVMDFVGVMSDDELDAWDIDDINSILYNSQYMIEIRVRNANDPVYLSPYTGDSLYFKIDVINLSTMQHLPYNSAANNPDISGYKIFMEYDPVTFGDENDQQKKPLAYPYYQPGSFYKDGDEVNIPTDYLESASLGNADSLDAFLRSVQPDSVVQEGAAYIYFDGLIFRLNNGVWDPVGPDNQTLMPSVGDVYLVDSFQEDAIGEQTGLKYVYVDSTDLMDGVKYYYSVTSYDKGDLVNDVPSLESSKFQNITTAIPQHIPLEYFGSPELEVAEHASGESTGLIGNVITSFDDLQGHDYEIRFYKDDPTNTADNYADYARLIDLDAQTYTVENEVVELIATSDSSAVGVISDVQVTWGKIEDGSTIARPFRNESEIFMPMYNHDGNPITPKIPDSTDYVYNLGMDKRVLVSKSVYDKLAEGEVVQLVASGVDEVFLSAIADKRRYQWYIDENGNEEEWDTRPCYIVFDDEIPESLEGLNVTIERNFASVVDGSVSIYDESGNLIANDNRFGLLEDAEVFIGTIDYTTGSFTLNFDAGTEIPTSVKINLEYTKFFTQNYSSENANNKIGFSNFNLEEAYDIALGNRDVFYGYDQVYSAVEVVEDSVLQKHGFDIVVRDPGVSVASIEWCENSNAGRLMIPSMSLGTAANPHDYKVVFTDYDENAPSNTSPNALEETSDDYAEQILPLTVENLTTGLTHKIYNKGRMGNNNPGVPVDTSATTYLDSFLLDWDQSYQSTLNMVQIVAEGISGSDLMESSAGFDVATLNFTIIDSIDFLGIMDTLEVPTELDTLFITSTRPFSTDDLYSFSTSSATDEVEVDMTKIRVVPNPYYIRARWDMDRYNRAVHFTHLPERCTVRIFTSAGSLVKILEKNDVLEDGEALDEYGTLAWNFQNENQRTVASGLYIFQVIRRDENGEPLEEFVGKFAIVLGP